MASISEIGMPQGRRAWRGAPGFRKVDKNHDGRITRREWNQSDLRVGLDFGALAGKDRVITARDLRRLDTRA